MQNANQDPKKGTLVEGLDRPRWLCLSFFALQQYARLFKEDPREALARVIRVTDGSADGERNVTVALDAFWGIFYCGLLRDDPTLTQERLDRILTEAVFEKDEPAMGLKLAGLIVQEAVRIGHFKSTQDGGAEVPESRDPNPEAEAAASQAETASASGSQKRSAKRSATA